MFSRNSGGEILRTVAVWNGTNSGCLANLVEVANSTSCNSTKNGSTSAVGIASFPLIAREIVNGIDYKLMRLLMQHEGFERVSGSREQLFECPLKRRKTSF